MLAKSAAELAAAKRSVAIGGAAFGGSFFSLFNVESARDNAIMKRYAPLAEEAQSNILILAQGMEAARNELRNLGFDNN